MLDRLARGVGHQVLLGNIGDVIIFVILRQQVIEGLILLRPAAFGDRQIPFLGIREDRVDVKDHAPERLVPVPDDLANGVFRACGLHVGPQ